MTKAKNDLQRELYGLLKKTEQVIQLLDRSAMDGIWLQDLEQPENGWISPGLWQTLGYKPADKINQAVTWQEVLFPEDLVAARRKLNQQLSGSGQTHYEQVMRFRHRDGSAVFMRCHCLIIRNESEEPIRLLGICRDITAVKALKKRLERKKKVIEKVVGGQSFFVITTDLQGRYTYANDYFCRCLELAPREILGKRFLDFVVAEDRANYSRVIEQCQRFPENSFYVQLRMPGPSQSVLSNQWELTTIANREGQPWEMLLIGYDTPSEFHSEQYFAALVETLDDAVFTLNPEGIILYASMNWLKQAGIPAGSMVGKPFLEYCPQGHRPEVAELLDRSRRQHTKPRPLEHQLIISPEEQAWAETKATYNEKLQQIILVCRNIRERRVDQRRLNDMAELLDETQRAARIGGWKLNLDNQSTIWTRGVYDIYEKTPVESGSVDLELAMNNYPPEEREKMAANLSAAIATQEPITWTSRFITDTQKQRWVEIQLNPEVENEQVRNLSGLIMDVTERVEAKQALLRKSKMQELLMKVSAEYINLPLERVNPAIQKSLEELGQFVEADRCYIFEVDQKQQTTSNTFEWCAEGIPAQIDVLQNLPIDHSPSLTNALERGHPYYIQDTGELPPGPEKEMLQGQGIKTLLAVPMYYDGYCQGFVGFDAVRQHRTFSVEERSILELFAELLVNVQQRSQAHQAQEDHKRQLQKLTENVPGAIYQFEMRPDGSMVMPFVSEGIKSLHPDLSPEILQKNAAITFNLIIEKDLPKVKKAMMASAKDLTEFAVDYRIRQPNGSLKWHRATSMPERREDGTIVWYGIFQDITRQKELEAIKSQAAQLQARNKELEQFASVASHDLQEPLRTVRNFAQLTERRMSDKLGEEGQQYLQFISDASARMSALIRGLLEYSQIGRNAREAELIDCNQMLQHIRMDLNAAIELQGAELHWGELPVVEGYPVELRQLFQNLISNAIKFSKPGLPPVVTIEGNAVNKGWRFSVSDNGIGIAKEQQNKIFEIFKRLHHRTEYEGTGIGLANCKKIVELHHGKIWVESEEGKGSSFIFTIQPSPHQNNKGNG